MKIGILQTAPNNCAFLNSLCRKSGVQLVNFVDEAVWEVVLNSGGQVTERVHDILAEDFMRLIEAGCDSIGLLCSLVKPGIEKVREKVPMPIIRNDFILASCQPTVTCSVGYVTGGSERRSSSAIAKDTLPTLPQYMSRATMSAEKLVSSLVIPVDMPTVPIAEKVSMSTSERGSDCVPQRTSAPQSARMRFVLTIMPVRFIASSGILRPNT